MNILIVGGTGMIGGHLAGFLASLGQDVTLAARKAPGADTPMAAFPVLIGDYTRGDFSRDQLAPFDAIVFAAGNDIRHIPRDVDARAFWKATQIDGVPNFAAVAREAGVKRFVQIGSYYHQVMPHLVDTDLYVEARALADSKTRALATPSFLVSTLNPPSIVGVVPGVPAKRYERLLAWARGQLDVPYYAPAGGTNYMSVQSLSEAIWGALQHAENGKAYLIGDENLEFRAFFQMFFDAVGSRVKLTSEDREHPILPDAFIVPGRGKILAYEPDAAETQLLGYRRHDVRRAVEEIVAMSAV